MSKRRPGVDAARGGAILAMVVYHGCWFAQDAGIVDLDMGALGWRLFQKVIAGSFFALVGVGLALGVQAHGRVPRWSARTAKLALCAGVVTVSSLVLDPGRPVFFGVLHSILACSLLLADLPRGPRWAPWLLAGVAIPLGFAQIPAADGWLWWSGLGTLIPPTFDYQPLFPWLGVVALGVGVGDLLGKREAAAAAPRPLTWLGRWSLWIYMAHVPLLMGAVMAWQALA